ncbi:peroxisomal membrane anchor protein conserved region-domain-containing protein [Cercophora newfieldiana]|uniref:Peroxisomal membrane protein PEX14 n=1 Tax=Cercophora newfieldiana TaxID=92897 RepID=A0AA39XWK2_9PEZI|nr:peroxisomal membrane anchor protein conserved region-domain-containing protein [Cercophora newfieldiana]
MAIREDLVASAAKNHELRQTDINHCPVLLDPSVASSPIEKRIAFLQAKNLTQEEVSAALARVGPDAAPAQTVAAPPAPSSVSQQPPYYAQYSQPSHPYPPYAWQAPPPEVPRRDWRDWFIMATVVGGASYGLYTLGKRYVYPLIAPPTPERLEQDKKSIDEQFEKTFALVDQLAKDTEALKAAERERTERLDAALGELETVISDLKSANRRRDDEAQRVRDDVQGLKDSIPRALGSQKDLTDRRLQEVNAELKSLKTLITQRMNPTATSNSVSNYLRPSSGNATPVPSATAGGSENAVNGTGNSKAASVTDEQPAPAVSSSSSFGRSSPFASGMAAGGAKASIPAWQLAMSKNAGSSSPAAPPTTNGADEGSSGQEAATSP